MLTKWFSLHRAHRGKWESYDSIHAEFHNIYQVSSVDQVQDYLEVISIDWASMSTERITMPRNDSGCHVSKPHRVTLQNLTVFMWVDFVIFVLTCIMANFVIM